MLVRWLVGWLAGDRSQDANAVKVMLCMSGGKEVWVTLPKAPRDLIRYRNLGWGQSGDREERRWDEPPPERSLAQFRNRQGTGTEQPGPYPEVATAPTLGRHFRHLIDRH